jgi:membrane protein implicated in regulation of membrane protease activity
VSQIMANVFLCCFLVGFVLTVISLLFGFDHGHHGFHVEGHHAGAGGQGHAPAGGGHGDNGNTATHGASFFSYSGMLMFLTWFGGVGYILNRHASGMVVVVLFGAVLAGLVGAVLVFLFLNKFLLKGETPMDPTEYYMPGTLARVTSGIRESNTGEITYVHGGTRKTCGARSDEEKAHPQGEEVVVVRYEKGIAYVKSVGGDLSVL